MGRVPMVKLICKKLRLKRLFGSIELMGKCRTDCEGGGGASDDDYHSSQSSCSLLPNGGENKNRAAVQDEKSFFNEPLGESI